MPPAAPPSTTRWPRGPYNDLIVAATEGSVERTVALLSEGAIDIDQGGPEGWTPLICAVCKGYARVVRILLREGASLEVAADEGFTALHFAVNYGRLAVTKMLLKGGASAYLELQTEAGATPLLVGADVGHPEIMTALIEAGANPNCRNPGGETPLYTAAHRGHLGAVKVLLRYGADPLLARGGDWLGQMTGPSGPAFSGPTPGQTFLPLDIAAEHGNSEVVQELIQLFGISGCGGHTGGALALQVAAQSKHVGIVATLAKAGAMDTGGALVAATGAGLEASVKALLQQRVTREPGGVGSYVDNARGPSGATAVLLAVGLAGHCCPRILRMLVDVGADTTSPVLIRNNWGAVVGCGSPMRLAVDGLRDKMLGGKQATEDGLNRLEAARRLLLRVDAARATSWLWAKNVAATDRASVATPEAEATPPIGSPLMTVLPILRRRAARRGRLVLAPLLRWVAESSHQGFAPLTFPALAACS